MKKITLLLTIVISIISIDLSAQEKQEASSYIVLKNAKIIDVISGKAMQGTLFLKDEIIEIIDYTNTQKIPKGAIIYDLDGKYVIPGLIDAHVHITHGTLKEAQEHLETAFKNGVTGVRDMGGDGRMLALLKKNMKIGEDLGPDVFFSTIIAGPEFFEKDLRPQQVAKGAKAGEASWQMAITHNSDLRQVVAEAKGLGATAIKVYLNVDKDLFKKIADEAKRQGLKVWAHAVVPPTKAIDITNGGADVMSHADKIVQYEYIEGDIKGRYDFDSPDKAKEYRKKIETIKWDKNSDKAKTIFNAMKQNNSILDPTLWVYKEFLFMAENEESKKASLDMLAGATKTVKAAYEAGVKIGAGSDSMIGEDGYTINIHSELELLVKAGLSNIDALRAATIINAEGLGENDIIGSVEKGKLANLVILNSNPLENISNSRDIKYVVKRGKVYDGVNSLSSNDEEND